MMMSFWWVWMVFLFVILLAPVSYGWGYRQWGPPYPRYVQRRRSDRAAQQVGGAPFDHQSWGWFGDFLWLMFIVWIFWFAASFWRW
jgi:hypothetical protein